MRAEAVSKLDIARPLCEKLRAAGGHLGWSLNKTAETACAEWVAIWETPENLRTYPPPTIGKLDAIRRASENPERLKRAVLDQMLRDAGGVGGTAQDAEDARDFLRKLVAEAKAVLEGHPAPAPAPASATAATPERPPAPPIVPASPASVSQKAPSKPPKTHS